MALTLDQLRRLADSINFRYYLDPNSPTLLCGAQGKSGTYQFVMSLQLDGRFLQLRTIRYQLCQANHPHTAAALRVLAELNHQLRFVKFGWDPKDGEVMAWGDIWLVDAGLTQAQFSRVLSNFLPAIDDQYPRVSKTIATGRDPGPINADVRPPDIETL